MSARVTCSPNTHAIASAMLDLPDPFGPTIRLMPGVNSRVVLSANDLKPRMESDRRNMVLRCYGEMSLESRKGGREFHAWVFGQMTTRSARDSTPDLNDRRLRKGLQA